MGIDLTPYDRIIMHLLKKIFILKIIVKYAPKI